MAPFEEAVEALGRESWLEEVTTFNSPLPRHFTPPDDLSTEYKWSSENDHDKTGLEWFASSDDTKEFTYSDGVISYKASAFGTTTTIKLEKEDWQK